MLASLLILVSAVQTLLYAPAACCMTAACVGHDVQNRLKGFEIVLYISTALWIAQGTCVAVTLCTVFVSPFVYSLTRMTTGDTLMFRMCTLFGIICTSIPTVNRVTLKFVRDLSVRYGGENEHKGE